jgi:hypothetical protein
MGDAVKAQNIWMVRNMAFDAIMRRDALRDFRAIID